MNETDGRDAVANPVIRNNQNLCNHEKEWPDLAVPFLISGFVNILSVLHRDLKGIPGR
jgi:hypothetical protein